LDLSSNTVSTVLFELNTTIWLADSPGATLVILDNLGCYCDIANIFIHRRQIQIVTWNNRLTKIEESLHFLAKFNYKEYVPIF
jgi:hypothetical protein